jgi:hypothetical protein
MANCMVCRTFAGKISVVVRSLLNVSGPFEERDTWPYPITDTACRWSIKCADLEGFHSHAGFSNTGCLICLGSTVVI